VLVKESPGGDVAKGGVASGRGASRTRIARAAAAGRMVRTLSVDIGASGIKAVALNELGEPVTERTRAKTPRPASPEAVLATIAELAAQHGRFHRLSVGVPGVVHEGVVRVAPSLTKAWRDFDLAKALRTHFRRPVRVANDADVQGYGAIAGRGVELVLTLGTGVGSALFVDGRLVPNLEVGDPDLSKKALQRAGRKKWNRRLARFVRTLEHMFHFERLYVGGGNSRFVDVAGLPATVTLVSNLNGLVGGIALWHGADVTARATPSGRRARRAHGEDEPGGRQVTRGGRLPGSPERVR